MRLPHSILMVKIKQLGLISENGETISFTKFKKIVDIHQYGNGKRRVFILFVGVKDNKIGFYPPTCTRVEMVKIAYEYLVDTITTDMKQEYLDENVQWGNYGIPLAYGNLRAIF